MMCSFYDSVANLNQISNRNAGLCMVLDKLRLQSCYWVVSCTELIDVVQQPTKPRAPQHMEKKAISLFCQSKLLRLCVCVRVL